jgi:hypothetical protein
MRINLLFHATSLDGIRICIKLTRLSKWKPRWLQSLQTVRKTGLLVTSWMFVGSGIPLYPSIPPHARTPQSATSDTNVVFRHAHCIPVGTGGPKHWETATRTVVHGILKMDNWISSFLVDQECVLTMQRGRPMMTGATAGQVMKSLDDVVWRAMSAGSFSSKTGLGY